MAALRRIQKKIIIQIIPKNRMIQRITKNTDINFSVDDAKIAEKFIIRFFTTDRTKAIVRTAEDVVTEADGKKNIKLPWSTLRLLNNGMLNYEVQNLAVDTDYNDGVFDSTFSAMSKYYIYSDVNDTDTAEVLNEKLDMLTGSKQDKLTAGKNVTIKDNTINAAEDVTIAQDRITLGKNKIVGENSISIRNLLNFLGDDLTYGVGDNAVGIGVCGVDDDREGWNKAVGTYAVAVGMNTTAMDYAVAVGGDCEAETSAISIGNGTRAFEKGISIGWASSAQNEAVAVGMDSIAKGIQSVCIGKYATSEPLATALGYEAHAKKGELVLRSNNKDMIKADANGKIYILDGATVMCIQDEIKALKTQILTMKTQMDKIDTSSSSTGGSWGGAK